MKQLNWKIAHYWETVRQDNYRPRWFPIETFSALGWLLCALVGQKYLLEQNFWMVRKYLVCAQENICVTKIIRSDRVAPGCLSRDGGRKISLRLQFCHLSIMKQLDKESQSTIASLTKSMSNYAKPKNVSSLILILKFSSLMNNIIFCWKLYSCANKLSCLWYNTVWNISNKKRKEPLGN